MSEMKSCAQPTQNDGAMTGLSNRVSSDARRAISGTNVST